MYGIFSKANCSRRKKRITVQALPGESRRQSATYQDLGPIRGGAPDTRGYKTFGPWCLRVRNNAGRRRRRNVASQGQAPFRKLQGVMKVDDILSWLRHGESKHKDKSKNKFRETTTISEFEVLVV